MSGEITLSYPRMTFYKLRTPAHPDLHLFRHSFGDFLAADSSSKLPNTASQRNLPNLVAHLESDLA